jgi:hypothetical protein
VQFFKLKEKEQCVFLLSFLPVSKVDGEVSGMVG